MHTRAVHAIYTVDGLCTCTSPLLQPGQPSPFASESLPPGTSSVLAGIFQKISNTATSREVSWISCSVISEAVWALTLSLLQAGTHLVLSEAVLALTLSLLKAQDSFQNWGGTSNGFQLKPIQ